MENLLKIILPLKMMKILKNVREKNLVTTLSLSIDRKRGSRMNLRLRYEEAIFLRDLIIFNQAEFGKARLKQVYGDIDIDGLIKQLDFIVMLAESIEAERNCKNFLSWEKADE